MPWNGQGGGGGGPWGGSGGPSPWGGGNKGPSGGGKGGGKGPPPPNLEEMLRKSQDRLRGLMPGGGGHGRYVALGVAVLVAAWLATGFYRVDPDEAGVVLRFGAYAATTTPGLHYHLPSPIETVETPKVARVNQIDIGSQTTVADRRQGVVEGPLLLTGDENIVSVDFLVRWSIKEPRAYLFNVRDPEGTVKAAAEAAIREVVGRTPIASVLADGKQQIADDMKVLLQHILDDYDSGIAVQDVQLQGVSVPAPVVDAYNDVQNALADQARLKNEAEAYSNSIVPVARGEAEQKIQNAEAYRQQVVAHAQGDAQRFLSVLQAYQANKDVTAERLYLETMEDVLKNANKVLVDKSAGGVLPYLPLPGIAGKAAPDVPDPSSAQEPSSTRGARR